MRNLKKTFACIIVICFVIFSYNGSICANEDFFIEGTSDAGHLENEESDAEMEIEDENTYPDIIEDSEFENSDFLEIIDTETEIQEEEEEETEISDRDNDDAAEQEGISPDIYIEKVEEISDLSVKEYGSDSVEVIQAESFEEYACYASELIASSENMRVMSSDESDYFYLKRLILRLGYGTFDYGQFSPETVIIGLDGTYIMQFSTSSDTECAYEKISRMENVDYVEPDRIFSIEDYSIKQKRDFSAEEYHYKHLSWGIFNLGVDEYAFEASDTDRSITVAVVDSGIDGDHPWLAGHIAPNGYDFEDNDNYPEDGDGHGTHVAGTVVDCTQGLNVMILPVRVADDSGEGSLINVANGITYAVRQGAKVINLSMGGDHSITVDNAINSAVASGSVVCIAAGNESQNTSRVCPAHMEKEGVICIAACDENEKRAYFSNYGAALDVIAPGVNIYSSYLNGTYEYLDGTSMAAPHIAGLCAMLRLVNPDIGPEGTESVLKSYCRDLGAAGRDDYYGEGIPVLSSTITDITNCSITLSQTEFVYNGAEIKPEITIKDGSRTLKEDTDYTLTFSDNVNVGTGEVLIQGKGRYDHSVKYSFVIKKADNVIIAMDMVLDSSAVSQTVGINASAGGNAKLEYQSDNSSISVNSEGYLYIPANYTGKAYITIRALATENYNETVKKISVTVQKSQENPDQAESENSDQNHQNGGEEKYFEYSVKNGEVIITGYNGTDSSVTIPFEIGGYPVTSIGSYGFTMNENLKQVTIGNNIKMIGDNAFFYCNNLEKAVIERNVDSIGNFAFYGCERLSEIYISDSVRTIGNFAFGECGRLKNITAMGRNTVVGENVFAGNAEGCVIKGYESSSFHKFAQSAGILFQFVDGKKDNIITASDAVKISSDKRQTFSLKAKALDGSGMKYSSNNKKIKVSSSGKVTIPKNFVGKAVIIIYSSETMNYKSMQKAVTVTVNPSSTKLLSAVNKKGRKLSLKWKRNSIGRGYEIQYSVNKNFKGKKETKKIRKNTVTSVTLKGLKKNKKYYVRIRTWKNVKGKIYYSKWSSTISRQIKK